MLVCRPFLQINYSKIAPKENITIKFMPTSINENLYDVQYENTAEKK